MFLRIILWNYMRHSQSEAAQNVKTVLQITPLFNFFLIQVFQITLCKQGYHLNYIIILGLILLLQRRPQDLSPFTKKLEFLVLLSGLHFELVFNCNWLFCMCKKKKNLLNCKTRVVCYFEQN